MDFLRWYLNAVGIAAHTLLGWQPLPDLGPQQPSTSEPTRAPAPRGSAGPEHPERVTDAPLTDLEQFLWADLHTEARRESRAGTRFPGRRRP